MESEKPKPVRWVGSSRSDVRSFPRPVRSEIGQALYTAQKGQTDPAANPLKGYGGGVLEIVADHRGDTWRAVYTVRFEDAVYVLHAFQKKSKRGIATPKKELDLIRKRLPHSATTEKGRTDMKIKTTKKTKERPSITESSGNVFADLGLANPEQELLKARLTLQIHTLIKQRGLTQTEAAELLGIKQPNVSSLMRNRAGGYSVGRLIDFLTALGQDVEITVRPTRKEHGALSVTLE